jgi:hypothetical protein
MHVAESDVDMPSISLALHAMPGPAAPHAQAD